MLTRKELERFRNVLGFNLGQVEKDYLQHLLLFLISKNARSEMVFKGGTCLQKAYGLGRFSEDLDFTLEMKQDMEEDAQLEGLEEGITHIVGGFGLFGYPATSIESGGVGESKSYRLRVQGPTFDGTDRSRASLTVDVSMRENILLEPDIRTLTPIYTDIPPYLISVMQPAEILAEKVRAILKRSKARDVYDAWFLLNKTSLDHALIGKKLEYYGMEFDADAFMKSVHRVGGIWDSELGQLLQPVPPFREVEEFIRSKMFA